MHVSYVAEERPCVCLQMRDWCRTPCGECRHTFLSRVFDGSRLEPCGDRCDVCRGENIAVAAAQSFEKKKLRMEEHVMHERCVDAASLEDCNDCGL
jgi:hypothetical protein